MPMNVPITALRIMVFHRSSHSRNGGTLNPEAVVTKSIFPAFGSARRENTSVNANNPTSTGIRPSPALSWKISKSKRTVPVIGSVPMVARNKPIVPASKPFNMLPRDTPAMQVSAMQISAKVSMGPNSRANCASCGAAKISTTAENSPPMVDAIVDQPMARSALPCCVIGKPSSIVAADCGVPGVLMRIAESDPP